MLIHVSKEDRERTDYLVKELKKIQKIEKLIQVELRALIYKVEKR